MRGCSAARSCAGLRIADAQVSYDRLVLENIDGIGGDAARVTGDAVRAALKQWKPSLECDLLAKARTAILAVLARPARSASA